MALLDEVRAACAWVAGRARDVRIEERALDAYAAALPPAAGVPALDPEAHLLTGPREARTAFFLVLDAINFGSGWFPTVRKRPGRSGYFTIALGLRERFATRGPWPAGELAAIAPAEVARALGQEPGHELMALFARSLHDLGRRVEAEHGGRFAGVVDAAGGSAERLVERLAGWDCFADASPYAGRTVPLLKRAQIAAADLAGGGVARFRDLDRLTAFADNLVPHVLRLDGVLRFAPGLVAAIERGQLLVAHSPAEVEMRAGAVHAVELLRRRRPDLSAASIDAVLWTRGGGPRYKAVPRPRCRTTAY